MTFLDPRFGPERTSSGCPLPSSSSSREVKLANLKVRQNICMQGIKIHTNYEGFPMTDDHCCVHDSTQKLLHDDGMKMVYWHHGNNQVEDLP